MQASSIFLNDFTTLDFAIGNSEQGLQGESFSVSAQLDGELDAADFLLDFGRAKRLLKELADSSLDHKLLLPAGLRTEPSAPFQLQDRSGGRWSYECPAEAILFLDSPELCALSLEEELSRRAMAALPRNVHRAQFFLRHPPRLQTEASFRYTHGLRLHDGNCQRLFHGHRNPIEIWREGRRDPELERRLATEWDGAHFASVQTIENFAALGIRPGQREGHHSGSARIRYSSAQGEFRAALPASRLIPVSTEPSIESLSKLALEQLFRWKQRGSLKVVAYEGLNKGAVIGA